MIDSPENLVARAVERTGSSDLGPDGWQVGLEQLVHAFNIDMAGDPAATERAEATLVSRLTIRLQIEAWYSAHGADAAAPVEGPLMIVGMPRSGTTAAHYLLSEDPAFRYLRAWEVKDPVPPPVLETEANDPRRLSEGTREGSVQHIRTLDGPVEDTTLHELHFHENIALPLPTYRTWWEDADHSSSFVYHERVLRLLQSHRPPTRWILKNPNYLFYLDQAAAAYPNARFVITHRDPVSVVPSACSVLADSRRRRMPDWTPDDPAAFGRETLDRYVEGVRRMAAVRDRIGEDRFIDVGQTEIEADAVSVAERIYDFAGYKFEDDVRDAMATWAAENRRGARGAHTYDPADYGLTTESIREAFSDYLDRFGAYC